MVTNDSVTAAPTRRLRHEPAVWLQSSRDSGIRLKNTKILASSPITAWQIEGEKGEIVTDVLFLGSKFTADGDCSHEIRRRLLPGKKGMTNLDSTLKNRDIILPTKVYIVKATVFPVVNYGCESWAIKKAEHQRIDAFELWCRKRLLRGPWTARRSNQSILREIRPEYSLEGQMLKLQYFGHLMRRARDYRKDLQECRSVMFNFLRPHGL